MCSAPLIIATTVCCIIGHRRVLISTLALSSLRSSSTSSSTSTTSPMVAAIFKMLSMSHACSSIPQHRTHTSLYPIRKPGFHFSSEWNRDITLSSSTLYISSAPLSLRPTKRTMSSPRYFVFNSCHASQMNSSSNLSKADEFLSPPNQVVLKRFSCSVGMFSYSDEWDVVDV